MEIPNLETIILRFHVKLWGCLTGGVIHQPDALVRMNKKQLPRLSSLRPMPRSIDLALERLVFRTFKQLRFFRCFVFWAVDPH